MVIGYNISGFDLPYLLDRAKAIKANQFPYLGRLISEALHIVASFVRIAHGDWATLNRPENADEGYALLLKGVWPA